jgi:predicted nucleotide-binding protein
MPEPNDTTPLALAEPDPRRVFLVYGRWHEAVNAMRTFLAALDLEVVEWPEAAQATRSGTAFVADILDAGLAMAPAAIVLLTPDEVAALHPSLQANEPVFEPLGGQPRQNVIFEAGMVWQRDRRRVLLVECGNIRNLRRFSDLGGVYTYRIDNTSETRQALAYQLKAIGCQVKTEGKTHWLTAGNFPSSLPSLATADLGRLAPQVSGVEALDSPLRGIPLRWILLGRLDDLRRARRRTDDIALDVQLIASQSDVRVSLIQDALSQLHGEGLVEAKPVGAGEDAIRAGKCHMTTEGLNKLRDARLAEEQ